MEDVQYQEHVQIGTWKFDKSINLSAVISLVLMFASFVSVTVAQAQRITRVETNLLHMEEAHRRQDLEIREIRVGIDSKLEKLNDKVDRLLEGHLEMR